MSELRPAIRKLRKQLSGHQSDERLKTILEALEAIDTRIIDIESGPIKTAAEVKAAIVKGVSVLKAGGVCVIDFHVEPPPERSDGIGHRATGD